MASLAVPIGLISSLNRAEEVATPSLPFELTTTAVPVTVCSTNASDKGVGNVRVADPDGITLTRKPGDIVANIDIVIAGIRDWPGRRPKSDVVAAAGIVDECCMATGRVTAAADVVCERIKAARRVEGAGGGGKKRGATIRRILDSVCIVIERLDAIGRIVCAGRVAIECVTPWPCFGRRSYC